MAKLPPGTPKYPWDDIERDYVAGVMPLYEIVARYEIKGGVPYLEKVAKRHAWTRQTPPNPASPNFVPHMFATPEDAVRARAAHMSVFSDEDIAHFARISVAQVVNIHRRDVSKMRSVATVLTDRLLLILDGHKIDRPCLGPRESPADLLEKVSRVLVRVVQLERQAYGIQVSPIDAGGGTSDPDQPSRSEFDELRDELNRMAAVKAKLVGSSGPT